MLEAFVDFATRGGIFSSQVGLVDVLFYLIVVGGCVAGAHLESLTRDAVLAERRRSQRLSARALRRQRELYAGDGK